MLAVILKWENNGISMVLGRLLLYSGKLSSDPNVILFVLSLSEWKSNTRNVCYNGRIFLCKMDRTKIKRTNQPEMAQNEIWTRRKFPTIRYAAAEISAVTVEHTHTYNWEYG